MTVLEFVNKYINTKVDFDGVYGAQCVDLFRQYCKDVLQIPHTGAVNGAKDLYINYPNMEGEKKYFYRINTGAFQFGDVLVWDKTFSNEFGHVAIFLSQMDANSVMVFEQNGIKQTGAKLTVRSKQNLLGVLRKK